MSPLVILAAVSGAISLWLVRRLIKESRARTDARSGFFDAVEPLFEGGEKRLQPTGFPRMTGRRNGFSFDLQAIPDSLTFRKLPTLWVMVTLPVSLPVGATIDVLARPSGQEPFTRFSSLPQSLPTPSGLPEGLAIRTDDATCVLPASLLARQADLFGNPKIKELVISPKGLRIVILADEADRGRYLIFREAELGTHPLDPARLLPLLDRLVALREDILTLPKDTG